MNSRESGELGGELGGEHVAMDRDEETERGEDGSVIG